MKEKTLYLHVGMDKTGTSALQWMLHHNRSLIYRFKNVYYPETGMWNDFSHHPIAFSVLNIGGYTEEDARLLAEQLDKEIFNKTSVLLSSECLFKITTNINFKLFEELYLNRFDRIKVIIYVRPQDEWVESRYKHSILSGSEISIEQLKKPHFCNYKRFIDLWAKEVGKDNVIVKAYEKEQFEGGNIFSDFLSIFDMKLTDDFILPTHTVNSSLSINGCEFKKLCMNLKNPLINLDDLNVMLLQYSDLEKDYIPKSIMSPQECKDLLNQYASINNQIALEYLKRKNGQLFVRKTNRIERWRPYEGLTREILEEISELINRNNPTLFMNLKAAVKSGINSNDPDIKNSAETLSPILNI